MKKILFSNFLILIICGMVFPQTSVSNATTWTAEIASNYGVTPNITYLTVNNSEVKLDVFSPRNTNATVPTLIYLHGGGWTGGDKNYSVLRLLPYLEMGWAVVNVNYRLGQAPTAVEDCRCALRWVIRNAQKHRFDVNKLVVTGDSSGSHLALTTGMLPSTAGLDGECPGTEELKVAAIINWYGVTDVVDVIEGANQQQYAVRWMENVANSKEVARRISPLEYVRAGLPAILTIHGDADTVAPYQHAVQLHKKLDDAKVPNQLLTIPGGTHGGFKRDEVIKIYTTIREFLQKQVVTK